jgi:hypothetical protein
MSTFTTTHRGLIHEALEARLNTQMERAHSVQATVPPFGTEYHRDLREAHAATLDCSLDQLVILREDIWHEWVLGCDAGLIERAKRHDTMAEGAMNRAAKRLAVMYAAQLIDSQTLARDAVFDVADQAHEVMACLNRILCLRLANQEVAA